ncbi:MAG TPA: M56 family metallopeptidase [Longimicrobiales bacterium]|nr:M56 family metallopeptidase [Longimicrobiales bacterium]
MTSAILAAALVHALWQGAAVAALVAAVTGARHWSAGARARVAFAGLAALPACIASTAYLLSAGASRAGSAPGAGNAVVAGAGAEAVARILDAALLAVAGGARAAAGIIIAVWASGAVIVLARVGLGLVGAVRMVADATPAPAAARAIAHGAAGRLCVRTPIAVLATDRVDVPVVIGGGAPKVLIPVAALGGAGTRELGPLIAHEVAHVKRRDWTMNLAQSVVEALVWYHPAVWWLSTRVRREREFACDDLAAAACGGAMPLARALSRLEEIRVGGPRRRRAFALSAARGPLLERVTRLVRPRRSARSAGARAVAAIRLAVAGTALAATAWVTAAVLPATGLAGVLPATGLAGGATSTLTAVDDAGAFTITFSGERAVAATVAGASLAPDLLRQSADSLYFLTPTGDVSFGVRLKPGGGITWTSRPAPPALAGT